LLVPVYSKKEDQSKTISNSVATSLNCKPQYLDAYEDLDIESSTGIMTFSNSHRLKTPSTEYATNFGASLTRPLIF